MDAAALGQDVHDVSCAIAAALDRRPAGSALALMNRVAGPRPGLVYGAHLHARRPALPCRPVCLAPVQQRQLVAKRASAASAQAVSGPGLGRQ